jgi:hypothetical protein
MLFLDVYIENIRRKSDKFRENEEKLVNEFDGKKHLVV